MDVNDVKENLRFVERSIARLKDCITAYEKYTSDGDGYWERSLYFWIRAVNRDAALLIPIPKGGNEDWA